MKKCMLAMVIAVVLGMVTTSAMAGFTITSTRTPVTWSSVTYDRVTFYAQATGSSAGLLGVDGAMSTATGNMRFVVAGSADLTGAFESLEAVLGPGSFMVIGSSATTTEVPGVANPVKTDPSYAAGRPNFYDAVFTSPAVSAASPVRFAQFIVTPGAPVNFTGQLGDEDTVSHSINYTDPIPEPGLLSILAVGAMGLLGLRRRP